MERPNHLHTENQSAASKVGGLVIVAVIHVVAILGLIAALAQGQILKQIQDIKASVERDKTPPKAPPPPPPDLVKPPPPTAIVPEFQVQTEAPPPPITTVKQAPPAPPVRVAAPPPPTELKPIARTHSIPPYPTISQRLGEQGTVTLKVTIGTDGSVTEDSVEKTSGSDRLDQAALDYVKSHWKWQPPTTNGQPTAATTLVNVKFDLKDVQ
jgi:periplasmic protein TonB